MVEFFKTEERPLRCVERLKLFAALHWRGIVCCLTPLIMLSACAPVGNDTSKYAWCGYTLLIMAVFWVSECIALPVTSFLPVFIFPFADIMSSNDACVSYINDTLIMFIGSLFLAASVEQSGLHKRLALGAIRLIGYSHLKLLFAMCFVTMFVSMWIVNTAATSMMVPIIFALLEVFEQSKLLSIYETTTEGDTAASDMTTLYFCAATYSATIGGIGTLVGTGTNLVFKGLFQSTFPDAPEYINFLKFSAFAVPYMLLMEITLYLTMAVQYLGFLRPRSEKAKKAKLSPEAMKSAKQAVEVKWKELGPLTYWELNVIILFSGCMVSFFCRSPQLFVGWGNLLESYFGLKPPFIKDSALAMLMTTTMWLFPSSLVIFKNFTAKYKEDLPKGRITSVLDWNRLNQTMPWSFMFLLGGGFVLSKGSGKDFSNLNGKIGEALSALKFMSNAVLLLLVIIFTVFMTNFASNVAVCNVITPIAMQMALETKRNPLWYNIASGFSASYCFMLPVGTPGNLLVQSAAKITTKKMIVAGFMPTVFIIIITWLALLFWAPIVWPDLRQDTPEWVVSARPPSRL